MVNDSTAASDRLTLILELTQAFNSSLDLDEVLDRVMDEVVTAVHAERGFVMLREPDVVWIKIRSKNPASRCRVVWLKALPGTGNLS